MPPERFQQEILNPQAVNNTGSDSVPDMDSYISSDVNDSEIVEAPQIQHVRSGSVDIKENKVFEKNKEKLSDNNSNSFAARQNEPILETDPGDR